MTKANLEHVNITVSDGAKTAQKLCDLFDWTVRWEGDAMNGQGRTWHVGNDDTYLAIYAPNQHRRYCGRQLHHRRSDESYRPDGGRSRRDGRAGERLPATSRISTLTTSRDGGFISTWRMMWKWNW